MRTSKLQILLVSVIATLPCTTVEGLILPDGATVELLATGFNFTEGPVYDGEGSLYFTNIYFSATPSQIIRYDESTGSTEVIDTNSGMANGLFFDRDGQLISMDMGPARVSRRASDDFSVIDEVLASEWNEVEFNSPNDLVIADSGGIYFTDPDFLSRSRQPEGVYYLRSDGELTQVISGFSRPNGIILSPNEDTLYLAVSSQNRIMAYDIGADGLPINEREFTMTNGAPDGLTIDPAGNLYAAVDQTVAAWDSSGQPLFELSVPEQHVSNLTFGGASGKTLYITASSALYGVTLVPEPDGISLACFALFGVIGVRRRTRRRFAHVPT